MTTDAQKVENTRRIIADASDEALEQACKAWSAAGAHRIVALIEDEQALRSRKRRYPNYNAHPQP